MYVISDGTLNAMTSAIFVEREEDVKKQFDLFVERTGVDPMFVTINPVGPPAGSLPK